MVINSSVASIKGEEIIRSLGPAYYLVHEVCEQKMELQSTQLPEITRYDLGFAEVLEPLFVIVYVTYEKTVCCMLVRTI